MILNNDHTYLNNSSMDYYYRCESWSSRLSNFILLILFSRSMITLLLIILKPAASVLDGETASLLDGINSLTSGKPVSSGIAYFWLLSSY